MTSAARGGAGIATPGTCPTRHVAGGPRTRSSQASRLRALAGVLATLLWAQAVGGEPWVPDAIPGVRAETIDGSGPEDPDTRAARLLGRMSDALRSLDYEGILVYLTDNRMETLHLIHRVDGGQVQERLVSLSGPVRAVTRSRDRVTCTMGDGHPISVKSHRGQRLLRAEQIDPKDLAGHYRVEVLGSARVAGREADVLTISPLDALRYGYRFHLDRATGLPLKSDLIDIAGDPVEQLLFTSITLDTRERPASALTDGYRSATEGAGQSPPAATDWRFEQRPAGYEQTMHDAMQDQSGARVEHFLFSDRLSSYSVYIEPDTDDGLAGVTRVGAAHAAGRRVGEYQVTAVGEVPAATVETAVMGVRRVPAAAQ